MAYTERPIDPQWLSLVDGKFAQQFSVEDEYFQEEEDSTEGLAIDYLMELLDPAEKDCLEMKFVAGMSYREVAEWMGYGKDKKKAWRACAKGLRKMRAILEGLV